MLAREDARAIHDAGAEPAVEALCELSGRVDLLQKRVKDLKARLAMPARLRSPLSRPLPSNRPSLLLRRRCKDT